MTTAPAQLMEGLGILRASPAAPLPSTRGTTHPVFQAANTLRVSGCAGRTFLWRYTPCRANPQGNAPACEVGPPWGWRAAEGSHSLAVLIHQPLTWPEPRRRPEKVHVRSWVLGHLPCVAARDPFSSPVCPADSNVCAQCSLNSLRPCSSLLEPATGTPARQHVPHVGTKGPTRSQITHAGLLCACGLQKRTCTDGEAAHNTNILLIP